MAAAWRRQAFEPVGQIAEVEIRSAVTALYCHLLAGPGTAAPLLDLNHSQP